MVGTIEKRTGHETARLELARVRVDGASTREAAVRHAVAVCARALQVERVGVWLLDSEHLTAAVQYLASVRSYTSGRTLDRAKYPRYFEALQERRVVAVNEARTEEPTRELAEDYLIPLGISSMLDAPIYERGEVVGVVCVEHVGPARKWLQDDVDFASSVADILSIIFEQARSLLLEAELRGRAARLRDEDRLDALARLAGSVAHDFNSVLTAVSLVSASLSGSDAARLDLHAATLKEAVDMGAGLVAQLAHLGRARTLGGDDIADVGDALTTLEHLMAALLRDRASLQIQCELPGLRLAMPTVRLTQVLMNLCLNAAEAMERPGVITLTARTRDASKDEASMVVIEVADDGPGIPDEILGDIFNPYFTTKSNGTGLGLATVRDIVQEYGGRITVDVAGGTGTTFHVAVPRA